MISRAFRYSSGLSIILLLTHGTGQSTTCHAFRFVNSYHSARQLVPRRVLGHPYPPDSTTHLAAAAAFSTESQIHASLPTEQVISYLRLGHTVTRQLIPANEIASSWKPQIMAAFEEERCEALRHEVHVFFGEKAYQACTTAEACLEQLRKKDADAISPFLQVFNLWRRHAQIKKLVFNKVL